MAPTLRAHASMSEGPAGWICAECKASFTETPEERLDRLERAVKQLRKEIRKKRPADTEQSLHAKHARKGVNEWAGAYSQTLGKVGLMFFRGALDDVAGDLKVLAAALRDHFGDSGGSVLFGRKDEEIMFAPLYEACCKNLEQSVKIQWDADICGRGMNGFSPKGAVYDSLVRVVCKLVSVLSSKDGQGDESPVELMDIGFKIIRGTKTRDAATDKLRALEQKASGKRCSRAPRPGLGVRTPGTGKRQPLHADGQDYPVAEVIVPLSEVFGGVELYSSVPRDTNRMGIASRRATCAARLAGARILQRNPVADIGNGIQGRDQTFTFGDVILLDATQPHQGPGIAEQDRLGLYCNIGTSNKGQKIFGGRNITCRLSHVARRMYHCYVFAGISLISGCTLMPGNWTLNSGSTGPMSLA